jgi:putative transposase
MVRQDTDERIRRDAFLSVDDLVAIIERYIAANNRNPVPFVWTATAELILGKVEAVCKRINRSPH